MCMNGFHTCHHPSDTLEDSLVKGVSSDLPTVESWRLNRVIRLDGVSAHWATLPALSLGLLWAILWTLYGCSACDQVQHVPTFSPVWGAGILPPYIDLQTSHKPCPSPWASQGSPRHIQIFKGKRWVYGLGNWGREGTDLWWFEPYLSFPNCFKELVTSARCYWEMGEPWRWSLVKES